MESSEIPIPEVPALAAAEIVRHPESGRECLLATTEDGERITFAFEVDSDKPGLEIVDRGLWAAAEREGSPEQSELRFEAVQEANADDWLQAVTTHPVGAEWLHGIKRAHPDAYHAWFAQTGYDEGGEEGSG